MAAGLVVLLVGCGSRTPAPQISRPPAAGGFQLARYPTSGVALAVPRTWTTTPAVLPQVAVISSAGAVIALWRYPRPGSPATSSQLETALRELIAQARGRQAAVRLIGSEIAPVGGHPAVELGTVQTIGSTLERVSSTHVFTPTEEVVLEEYAPAATFPAVDRSVFARVRRSLSLSAR